MEGLIGNDKPIPVCSVERLMTADCWIIHVITFDWFNLIIV